MTARPITGAGLGLRRAHMGPLLSEVPAEIDFLEVSPENWLGVGGRLGQALEAILPERPLVCHGLSLNLGGLDPIDESFVREVGGFLARFDAAYYGDHLTFCAHGGHLYELLPLPFTIASAEHLADRIKRVQDLLGRRITVENPSYYCAPGQEIPELEFISRVLERADCHLLLDVNNAYVNGFNNAYDASAFIRQLDGGRIAYLHVAGHEQVAPDLIIDTHGEPVIDPVYALLADTYAAHGPVPTLLERDENIPPLEESLAELRRIKALQREAVERALPETAAAV